MDLNYFLQREQSPTPPPLRIDDGNPLPSRRGGFAPRASCVLPQARKKGSNVDRINCAHGCRGCEAERQAVSRVVYLDMDEGKVIARCLKEKVRVSAIERLPSGGVRLVCMSTEGAEHMRTVLNARILQEGDVARERHRPSTPLW